MISYKFRPGDAKLPRFLTIEVARYAQQAVLMAVVDEARYHVLMSHEGKVLVEARYAVRNNQRNFLKLTLPKGATIWSAVLAGKPVRPGQAPDGGLLLPLEKSRAGDEAPVFSVEVVYLARDTAWTEKGKARLTLPTLDLPISRSAVVLYHAPQFKVTEEPGTFRVEPYEAPFSPALTAAAAQPEEKRDVGAGRSNSASFRVDNNGPNALPQSAAKALDDFRNKSMSGKSAKVLPIRVSFPAFGTSLFLVSELTAENQAPAIELSYQREKKDGGQ
jgi:hypothetical protein